MVLSIRSMLTEFFCESAAPSPQALTSQRYQLIPIKVLMGVAVFCFLGFAYALFTLAQGRFEISQIGWWLLEVYFGLDASGFESARERFIPGQTEDQCLLPQMISILSLGQC